MAESKQPLLLVYLPLMCLLVLVALPVAIYSAYMLHADWNKQYVLKRRRSIVFIFLIELCVLVLIRVPLTIAQEVSNTNEDDKTWNAIINTFEYFLFGPIVISIGPLLSIRAWLLYYDMSLSKLDLTRQWRKVIDPLSESNDWFIKNQYRWGNAKFLLRIGFIAVLIQMSTMIVGYLTVLNDDNPKESEKIGELIGYAWWLGYCIFMITIWFKLRVFDYYDNFGIRTELLILGIYTLIVTIVGTFIVLIIFILSSINDDILIAIETYFAFFAGLFAMFIMPLTKWQNEKKHTLSHENIFPETEIKKDKKNKNKNKKNRNNKNKNNIRLFKSQKKGRDETATSVSSPNIVASKSGTIKSREDSSNSSSFHIQIMRDWTPIVITEYGYNAFMAHLQKEFSVENLLFISEYMQIKNVLKDHLRDIMLDIMDNNRRIRYNIALPSYDSDHTNLNNQNNNNRENEQSIPMSQIAKELKQKIILWQGNQDDDNTDELKINIIGNEHVEPPSNMTQTQMQHVLSSSVITDQNLNEKQNNDNKNVKNDKNSTLHELQLEVPNEIKNLEMDLGIVPKMNSLQSQPSIINDSTNNNSVSVNSVYSRKADIISMNISKYIIIAFKQLYFKYIGDSAVYMINISSRTRATLIKSLDPKYFYNNKPINEDSTTDDTNNNNSNSTHGTLKKQRTIDYFTNITNRVMNNKVYSPRNSQRTSNNRFSMAMGMTRGRGNSRSRRQSIANPNNKAMIEFDLEAFIQSKSANGLLTEKDLYEWVLLKLMKNMEEAIREVSRVMNDSYLRFKNNTSVFRKVLKLTQDATINN